MHYFSNGIFEAHAFDRRLVEDDGGFFMPKGSGERSSFFQLDPGCLDKVIAYRQIGKIDPHVGSFAGPGDIVSPPVPSGTILPEINRIDDAEYIFYPLNKTFKNCLKFTPYNIHLLILPYHTPLLNYQHIP